MAKTTLIVTDRNFRITIPEEIRLAERITQGDLIEIEVRNLGKHEECIKRILTNNDRDFFKVNSQGNIRVATLKLSPSATTQRLIIPTKEGYGIKLTFKDANGDNIPDEALIELRKENISSSKLIGQHEYREFKKEIKPPKNQINISSPEQLAIYVEEKYAGNIQNIEFRFAVELCGR